jgi:glycosyltransferase involved in cell wall biosynthesis
MTKRLRVAMTLEQCWHDVPGGVAVAALESARALIARQDIELVGVAAAHRHPPLEAWRPPIEVKHHLLPRLALYESWHRLRRPKVESASGPIDVIHATTNAIPPRSAPLVVTVHDLAWLHDPAHFTARGVSFFDRGLKLALEDADLVVCPSKATIADCERYGFASDRLRYVPMGVGAEKATAENVRNARQRYGLTDDYILWTGTVEPRKNLTGLLSAFRDLDSDLTLALAGPKGWNEDLAKVIEPVKERVKVLGFVPHVDLAPLYAGARVFCFPSLFEGFGLPVLEAMVQGTPVVTSRGTSTEEIAEGAGVLVDPHDPASIRDGIARVLENDGLAQSLAGAGRARAAEFPWARTADLLAEAYFEVAG